MAPAGDVPAFLAALAAGADAIYLGLKHFSARMQAENFSISQLSRLANLAHDRNARVYVAMNTLLKPGDPEAAGRLLDRLNRLVRPDAIIVQDLGLVNLARQTGFSGEIHLSTLANLTHGAALRAAAELGASRVVLPRELSLDEIKMLAASCPAGLDLEVFVHGALCYCVSGRCWWSSWLGGKSGLRGRCVQPCRRLYRQGPKGKPERLFSCLDLSLDVLARPLQDVPRVQAWKIEGRKKGPHYVYYTVKAYRLLRDEGNTPEARKTALSLLDQALGRPRTHAGFLPQRPHKPVDRSQETGSGLFLGTLKRETAKAGGRPITRISFQSREELLPGDLLRLGYEDEPWHRTVKVRQHVPKRGRLDLRPEKGLPAPPAGGAVFLVDRREPELARAIAELERVVVSSGPLREEAASEFRPSLPAPAPRRRSQFRTLCRVLPKSRLDGEPALWLEPKALHTLPPRMAARVQWWLPPVIWPEEEARCVEAVDSLRRKGARDFVCNAPWQIALFPERKGLEFTAGPFCNISNALALEELRAMGFGSAYVSPELPAEDLLALPGQSPLPLHIVLKGLWPLGLSRHLADGVHLEEPLRSPMNEVFWVRRIGQNHWVYPNWELDLSPHKAELEKAGYSCLLTIREFWPKTVPHSDRQGRFNWSLRLL
ncbi:U32 family peptidase [Desulfovibrio aminophilus]|uniref:peptidase U32 family protein n=1 Tax=Desulfovibrio aminophilus TaxID=81425 RepID=UPI0033935276